MTSLWTNDTKPLGFRVSFLATGLGSRWNEWNLFSNRIPFRWMSSLLESVGGGGSECAATRRVGPRLVFRPLDSDPLSTLVLVLAPADSLFDFNPIAVVGVLVVHRWVALPCLFFLFYSFVFDCFSHRSRRGLSAKGKTSLIPFVARTLSISIGADLRAGAVKRRCRHRFAGGLLAVAGAPRERPNQISFYCPGSHPSALANRSSENEKQPPGVNANFFSTRFLVSSRPFLSAWLRFDSAEFCGSYWVVYRVSIPRLTPYFLNECHLAGEIDISLIFFC